VRIYHKNDAGDSNWSRVDNCEPQWSGSDVTVSTTVDHFSYFVIAIEELRTQPYVKIEYSRFSPIFSEGIIVVPCRSRSIMVGNYTSQSMYASYLDNTVITTTETSNLSAGATATYYVTAHVDGSWNKVTITTPAEHARAALFAHLSEVNITAAPKRLLPVNVGSRLGTSIRIHIYTLIDIPPVEGVALRKFQVLHDTVLDRGQMLIMCSVPLMTPVGGLTFVYDQQHARNVNAMVHGFVCGSDVRTTSPVTTNAPAPSLIQPETTTSCLFQ
jgi:hypothetical protein